MQNWQTSEIFNEAPVFVLHQQDRVAPTDKGRRAYTMAAIVDRDGVVHIGTAIVNPVDEYNKTIGGDIAVGRAKAMMADYNRLKRIIGRKGASIMGPRVCALSSDRDSISAMVETITRRFVGKPVLANQVGINKIAKFLEQVDACSIEKAEAARDTKHQA